MQIKVFGPGCSKCQEAERLVTSAVREAGIEATVEKVSDFRKMMSLGIMSTPAVAIDGKVVCTGHLPTKNEVLDWLSGKSDAKTGSGNCACGLATDLIGKS